MSAICPASAISEHVAALPRTQAHSISHLHFHAVDGQPVDLRLVFQQLPLPLVHGASSLSGRRPRTAPCSFMNCSTGMASVRSRIWRARSSDWRISRFSSSVKRHDAQRKDLVDLRAVEQIAGAFGSNLRIIVENDGGSQQSVALAWISYQHRPRANVLTLRGELLQFRPEAPAAKRIRRLSRPESYGSKPENASTLHRGLAAGISIGVTIPHLNADLEQVVADRLRRDLHVSLDCFLPTLRVATLCHCRCAPSPPASATGNRTRGTSLLGRAVAASTQAS